ncbi:hypothetical protein L917_10405 [Phytophthora nicotianae]|uniref:Uncharacterized protein n=1 Tax=Phytophthora nicotianae TaxID=4792 RepID=W2L0N6_PHYNI|nr:hypothetical protein L917_10405 [Phytophthora nicotianae]
MATTFSEIWERGYEDSRKAALISIVLISIDDYVKVHPCFYFEEIKSAIKERFPDLGNISDSTVC